VRETLGVPPALIRHFSRRRAAIEDRLTELRADYRATHGREPSRAVQLQLAQQATLETREGKAPGRTLAEQVADWTAQAREVIGERGLDRLVADCTGNTRSADLPSDQEVHELARRVVRRVAEERSTWTVWNVHAETERLLRGLRFANADERERVTNAVVATATGPRLTIRIAEPELVTEAPSLTRASDGQSVFLPHGSHRFTTSEVLLAEERLVTAARVPTRVGAAAPHLDPVVCEAAVAVHEATHRVRLDAGQRQLVTAFATAPARIAVGIGPAGSGKTTAMRAFAAAWHSGQAGIDEDRARLVPLATSAKAAQVLGEELGVRAENLHKFLHENDPDVRPTGPTDDWFMLRAGDVLLVDEAGMAGTLQLARLLEHAEGAGAAVRLLGDPAQLASVDAGGALRLLEREAGATYLSDPHRFSDRD
jgi:ATP-dependent exoDNAse (exonuclease V) alpha subunit